MKKAIKDLTEEDVKKLCNKNIGCINCPLLNLPLLNNSNGCYADVQILKQQAQLLERKVDIKD